MKTVLGLTNTSPYQIKFWLKEFLSTLDTAKQKKLTISSLSPYEKPKDTKLILCLGLQTFKKHLDWLQNTKAVVLLFDGPVVLGSANIPLLDALPITSYRWKLIDLNKDHFISRVKLALQGKEPMCDLHYVDHLQHLLDSKLGDFSGFVQSLTMKSRDPSARRQIQKDLMLWLFNGSGSVESLCETVLPVVGQQEMDFIKSFFDTDVGKDAVKVFYEIGQRQAPKSGARGKNRLKKSSTSIPYDKICAGTKITSFDAKFMMKAYKATNEVKYPNLSSKDSQKAAVYTASALSEDEDNGNI